MCRESLIDFEKYYEVYDDGRIWSKYWKRFIEPQLTDDGYLRVSSLKCKDGKKRSYLINRIIYYYFMGDIPDGIKVNHKDENKLNNNISNLNLLTHKENCNWGTRNKRISTALKGKKRDKPTEETRQKMSVAQKKRFDENSIWNKGKNDCFSEETLNKMRDHHKKTPVIQLSQEGEIIGRFESLMEVQRRLNINASQIMRCCKGKNNTAGGYKWKYET